MAIVVVVVAVFIMLVWSCCRHSRRRRRVTLAFATGVAMSTSSSCWRRRVAIVVTVSPWHLLQAFRYRCLRRGGVDVLSLPSSHHGTYHGRLVAVAVFVMVALFAAVVVSPWHLLRAFRCRCFRRGRIAIVVVVIFVTLV